MTSVVDSPVIWSDILKKILGGQNSRAIPPWVKLPSPPLALMRCIQKAQDVEAAPGDLAVIIESDAGLTCQILRRVNSAASGSAHPANTIAEALARLGVNGTVLYLTTECMKQSMQSGSAKLIHVNGFAAANLERALFAKYVARALHADEELAFSAALIADCLLPVLTNQAFQTYLRFLQGQLSKPQSVIDFEKKEFGWTHPQATATIFAGWGFPEDLVCCVGLHHAGLRLLEDRVLRHSAAAAVAAAGLVPDQLNQEPDGVKSLRKLPALLPGFDLLRTVAQMQDEFHAMAPELKNDFPLARRLAKRD